MTLGVANTVNVEFDAEGVAHRATPGWIVPPLMFGPGIPITIKADPWLLRRWLVEDALNRLGDAMPTVRWGWPA
jgi:hypothetical protein